MIFVAKQVGPARVADLAQAQELVVPHQHALVHVVVGGLEHLANLPVIVRIDRSRYISRDIHIN